MTAEKQTNPAGAGGHTTSSNQGQNNDDNNNINNALFDFFSGLGGAQYGQSGNGVDYHQQQPFPAGGPGGFWQHGGPMPHRPGPPPPPPPPAAAPVIPGAYPPYPAPPPHAGPWGPPGYNNGHMWWPGESDGDHDGPDGRHGHGHGHGHHHRRRHGRHHGRHGSDDDNDDDNQNNNEKAKDEKGADKATTATAASTREKDGSPDTMEHDMPDPEEVAPEDGDVPPAYFGAFNGFGGFGGRGGRFGGVRGGGWRHGGRRGRNGPHCHGAGRRGGGPWSGGAGGGFDFPAMMRGFMNHPFFQSLRDHAGSGDRSGAGDDNDAFQPPADVFSTDDAYVVHVALPGAKKDDIGVTWNPDAGSLSVAGVVHRPGDEQFIASLVSGERRVGMFERSIALPPAGAEPASAHQDVDPDAITARMDDGVLIVTVPKVEREWTEVRKVDIL